MNITFDAKTCLQGCSILLARHDRELDCCQIQEGIAIKTGKSSGE